MGRKGMKGFMKSATRPSDKPADDEAAEEQQAAAPPSAAAGSKGSSSSSSSQPRAAEPESTPKAAASDSEDEGQGGKESRSKMLQRHKRVRQLWTTNLTSVLVPVLSATNSVAAAAQDWRSRAGTLVVSVPHVTHDEHESSRTVSNGCLSLCSFNGMSQKRPV
jgi:hypothetical protein